jgi:hypothetical protein
MPNSWTEFFCFCIDPDELSERAICQACEEFYITVDDMALNEVIDVLLDHWVHEHA